MSSPASDALLSPDAYALTEDDRLRFVEEEELGMVQPQSPILTSVAEAVEPSRIKSPSVQKVIARLFASAEGQRTSRHADKKRRTLVGLAAPQIGSSLRIILVDTRIGSDRKQPGKLECFINPEIVWRSRETVEGREGCFSAGPVWGLVRRPIAIKLRALTPEGHHTERILEGFTARIAQHERDHLDGIRFADLITSDRKRHWVHTEELALYPQHIQHWKRPCTRERWEAFKAGKLHP
jgi:peptide deformylase